MRSEDVQNGENDPKLRVSAENIAFKYLLTEALGNLRLPCASRALGAAPLVPRPHRSQSELRKAPIESLRSQAESLRLSMHKSDSEGLYYLAKEEPVSGESRRIGPT